MAIVMDTHTRTDDTDFNDSPTSAAHTTSEGARVDVLIATINETVSSMTFGGTSMTAGVTVVRGSENIAHYYLNSRAAGDHVAAATLTGSSRAAIYVETGTGMAADAPESSVTDTEGSTAVVGDGSDVVPTSGAFIMSMASQSNQNDTWDSVTTVTEENDTGAIGDGVANGMLEGASAGAASVDWTASVGAGENLVCITISIAEAAVGGATPKGPLGHPLQGPFGGPI